MFLFRLCCELVVAEVSRLWKSCLGRSSTPVGVLLVLDVSGEWWKVWCLFTFQGFALRESEVMECQEFHSCLAQCCTVFNALAFAWLKSHPCSQLTVCHVCCCARFHPHVIHVRMTLTRHRLVSTAHAIDLVKSPSRMVAELTLGGTA